MAQYCQVTGKKPVVGNRVSHSHRLTKRRFLPNLKRKRYWVPEENRFVTLTVSTHGMKIIDKVGISKVLRDLRRRGEKLRFSSPKKSVTAIAAKQANLETATPEEHDENALS